MASKRAAADKKAAQAHNQSLQKLAMLNDKLSRKDSAYVQQHAMPKKTANLTGIAAVEKKAQKKKVVTDVVADSAVPATVTVVAPRGRHQRKKTAVRETGLSTASTATQESTTVVESELSESTRAGSKSLPVSRSVAQGSVASVTDKTVNPPVRVDLVDERINSPCTLTKKGPSSGNDQRQGIEQEGISAPMAPVTGRYGEQLSAEPPRFPSPRLTPKRGEKRATRSREPTVRLRLEVTTAEVDSGESSGSEYQAPEGLEAMESSGDGFEPDESEPDSTRTQKGKKKQPGKRKGSGEGATHASKKPKPRPVREAIQTLQKNSLRGATSEIAPPKRKVAPEPSGTAAPIASKRSKPSIVQGIDRDWLKENASKGAVKKVCSMSSSAGIKLNGWIRSALASKGPAEKADPSGASLGGVEDEDPGATAALGEAKANVKKAKGGRTIAAMGLKATVAVDTDAAVKKEAEDKPVRLQSMDDIPFRSADEYRTFDNTYVIAMLDWASTSDDPFGTNEHPQIDKMLQKVWNELLPDNPLNVNDHPAIKKVVADRFNNHRSTIGKIGRNVVKDHLQAKVDKDPMFDVSSYARRMAPRMKPFLFLYKDPEASTGPIFLSPSPVGAFESEFICTVFAAHLKRVATSPFNFHMGNPVEALALSAVSVECAFKEYQRNEEGIANQKGLPFGSNEWGSPAVGWSAYIRKFSAEKWTKIFATTSKFIKNSGRSALDSLQTHVDTYEERAMVELSDEDDAGNEFADAVASDVEGEGPVELGDEDKITSESDDEGSMATLETRNRLSSSGLMVALDDEGSVDEEQITVEGDSMAALDDEGSVAELSLNTVTVSVNLKRHNPFSEGRALQRALLLHMVSVSVLVQWQLNLRTRSYMFSTSTYVYKAQELP
ncbi:hypothetical protein K488DRAFT_74593 [Vararia minispora EC-137]|uniref:Uncharacterized protein n=1 Tax=Vararia minispora EC-137 TaxID=1314806 RepID=A0ACB8Q6E6_9AGAM|nr:hypothetical protein K488DRAFT_74593 [Vararia minispora EC-137]